MQQRVFAFMLLAAAGFTPLAYAQGTRTTTPAGKVTAAKAASTAARPVGVTPPPGYLIGADDLLSVVFWGEEDMSLEVIVRPDGMISLPLLNDVQASGLTPEQLRVSITGVAGKFVEDPTVTVVVKAINSRRVFILGQIGRPGPYPLTAPTTVLQLLALAGGVNEYAKSEEIQVMRTENGKTTIYPFNYQDVVKGKKLEQNMMLTPGDTVIIP
jgi:polysaccharide export outer membrane protein